MMALPNFLQFGKSYSNKDINLSADKAAEIIDASQTSGSTIELGSGATTATAGDFGTVTAGSGNDFVYSARGESFITGSGNDTFAFGIGSKAQTPGMIGACVVDDSTVSNGKFDNGETIEISKSFMNSSQLAAAISSANAEPQANVDANGRTLTIDGKGDSITFLSGEQLNINNFKLV